MGIDDVIARLEKAVARAGSAAEYAMTIGISPQYLSEIRRRNRNPPTVLLDALGLEAVWSYRKKRRVRTGEVDGRETGYRECNKTTDPKG